MQQQAQTAAPEAVVDTNTETIEVGMDVAFMEHLMGWHQSKVAVVTHMLSVPDGTMAVGEGTVTIKLTGEVLAGFKLGLSVALAELGKLPFELVVESPEAVS